jgi:hypothetical protein
MSANLFNNRFYGNREPAWHNLGIVSDVEHNAQETLAILGSYWIDKRPVTIFMNGEAVETGDFALVRSAVPDDPRELNFGYCTKWYNVVQPDQIASLFDDNVKVCVETMGMLGSGEKIFLTWTLPSLDVKGDEVKTYGFVACGYDGKFGASLSLVTTRVVCQNTFNAAISESESSHSKESGRGRVYNGKHNSANVARDLGIWMEHVQDKALGKSEKMQESFVKMAETKVDDTASLANLLFKIYPDPKQLPVDYPEKLRGEKQESIDAVAEKASRDRTLVEALFNGEGTAIDATAWGLFNSVTEYENWGRSTKKSADYSILMGNRANTMAHAYSVINNWMENK